ncbi:MAG: phosphatase PAP2 family protein [Bacteroidia bacterium]
MKKLSKIFILLLIIPSAAFNQSDTSKLFLKSNLVKHFSAPILLAGTSIYTLNKNVPLNKFDVQKSIVTNYPNFHTKADDYLLYVPVAITYGIGLIDNNYTKNDFTNRSILLVKSAIIMSAIVYPAKYIFAVERPDNSEFDAFPSGHTSNAFMMATFMHEELKHKSIWYSIGAYSIATSVGVMRMLNNRHWNSDVLMGAAIGIASTKIAYLTHKFKWGKDSSISLNFTPYFLVQSSKFKVEGY